jgi:hypothetical protein
MYLRQLVELLYLRQLVELLYLRQLVELVLELVLQLHFQPHIPGLGSAAVLQE